MIVSPVTTDLRVVDTPLAYELENRIAIDAYWTRRLEYNPRLWNGPFFMFRDVTCDNAVLRATAHRTDFSAFLFWLHNGRNSSVTHITGTSLIRSSDGVLVAMQMASHTANAGNIYFPAGSFDSDDIVNGRLDPLANVRRELVEETGLVIDPHSFEDAVAVHENNSWHVALPCRLALSFAECEAQVAAYQKKTGDDEISRLVPIRSKKDAKQLVPYAKMLAEYALSDSI